MKSFGIQFAVACAVALLAGSASASVISNGGFELGTAGDATDWAELSGASGSVTRSSLDPFSGSFHAYMQVDHVSNPPGAGAYFFEQNLGVGTIDNSLNYDLSFVAKSDSTDFTGVDMFFQILWLDQDGSDGGGVKGETLTSLIGLGINTTYQPFGLSDVDVPDGTDSYLLRFQLAAGPIPGVTQGLSVDDVSLTAIPEPASIGLLMVGALFVRRRR